MKTCDYPKMLLPNSFAGRLLTAVLLTGTPAIAGNITWSGSVNNIWNTTDANWTGDATIYTDGDDVLFDATANGEITEIVSRSPGSTVVDSPNKITFATNIQGDSRPIGGPSILTGRLVKNGSGELELGDPGLGQQFGPAGNRNQYANSFSSITVNAGTLRYRARAALGSGTVTLAGGAKIIQASEEGRFGFGNEAIDNDFFLSGGLAEFPMAFGNDNKGVWIRNGVVSGPGGILITGSSRSLALSSDNTFSGGVTIDTSGNPGLVIGSYQALGTGTLTVSHSHTTSGGLSAGSDLPGNATYPNGVTNAVVITSNHYFHVACNSASASLRLGGDISGAGTLRKWRNDSTVILSGNNTYHGGTIVADGTLICDAESALGTGPLDIAAGALLQLDFVGSANVPSLTVSGGSALPNGTYGSSASPAENQDDLHFSGLGMVTVGPPKTPTTTAIVQTGGTNPIDIGLPVTFTATVSGGTPTGTVAFYDDLTLLGSDTLNGSFEASVTSSALAEGARVIIAQYQGDATYASSTSAGLNITVEDDRPASTTALAQTSGANPSIIGSTVTYTATVSGDTPTGQVVFYDRDQVIGSSALDGSFQASITTGALPVGPRPITAQYVGDTGNRPSSDTYEQVVNPTAGSGKLKVFILAGQSNMQGHGRLELGRNPEDPTGPNIEGGLGTLRFATARDPLKYGYLLDPANPVGGGKPGWITRDDVYVSAWDTLNGTTVERRAGNLDAGFGVDYTLAGGRIGPEYGFGHVVGAALDDEVLIIKTSWGGKSLQVDFRPPSSGGTTGAFYLDMVSKVNLVLNELATYYPGYDGREHVVCGFGWHQGWNDRVNASAVAEYEVNLANLIRDIRTEFNVTNMPFVIGNTGLANAPSTPGSLLEAQGNVSDPVLYPEFAGTVTTVDTRPFDYGEFQGANNQGYHWYGNGESYLQVGESMGEAMLALLATPTPFADWASDPIQGLTAGVNDGAMDDPDLDGIVNLLEFVLKGDPLLGDAATILPTGMRSSGGSWVFEYDRNKRSSPSVSQVVEHSTDLENWIEVPIPETTAGSVTITPGIDADTVSVAIPVTGPRGYARLRVAE